MSASSSRSSSALQKEEDLDRFAKATPKTAGALECYLMIGNRDYLLRVVAADLSAYVDVPKERS